LIPLCSLTILPLLGLTATKRTSNVPMVAKASSVAAVAGSTPSRTHIPAVKRNPEQVPRSRVAAPLRNGTAPNCKATTVEDVSDEEDDDSEEEVDETIERTPVTSRAALASRTIPQDLTPQIKQMLEVCDTAARASGAMMQPMLNFSPTLNYYYSYGGEQQLQGNKSISSQPVGTSATPLPAAQTSGAMMQPMINIEPTFNYYYNHRGEPQPPPPPQLQPQSHRSASPTPLRTSATPLPIRDRTGNAGAVATRHYGLVAADSFYRGFDSDRRRYYSPFDDSYRCRGTVCWKLFKVGRS
jgi:hypothetical protein